MGVQDGVDERDDGRGHRKCQCERVERPIRNQAGREVGHCAGEHHAGDHEHRSGMQRLQQQRHRQAEQRRRDDRERIKHLRWADRQDVIQQRTEGVVDVRVIEVRRGWLAYRGKNTAVRILQLGDAAHSAGVKQRIPALGYRPQPQGPPENHRRSYGAAQQHCTAEGQVMPGGPAVGGVLGPSPPWPADDGTDRAQQQGKADKGPRVPRDAESGGEDRGSPRPRRASEQARCRAVAIL